MAAGIPEPLVDHALRAARFCLQIVGAAQMCLVDPSNPARGCLTVRVGMASGPAVGSCVSATRPKFTLVGDTVNTAARMVRLQHARGHQSAVSQPSGRRAHSWVSLAGSDSRPDRICRRAGARPTE